MTNNTVIKKIVAKKTPLAKAILKGMAVGVLPLFLFSQNAVASEVNRPSIKKSSMAKTSVNSKYRPVITRNNTLNTSNAPVGVDNNSIIRNIHHKLSAFKNNLLKPRDTVEKQSDVLNFPKSNNRKTTQIRNKSELLAEKMTKAEFTVMALNDLTFVKQALEVTKRGAFTDDYAQCVFEHLDRANYLSELQEVAQYLVDNYPNDVDAYIEKLDFLIPVVRQIHNHPESVSFNSDSLADSSALMILTQADAEELERTINDERYRPLLATIGLPAKRADGKIEDISIMQVDSIMEYIYKAEAQCQ